MKRKLSYLLMVVMLVSLTPLYSFATGSEAGAEVGYKNLAVNVCKFVGKFTVTNNNDTVFEDWRLEFDFPGSIKYIQSGEVEKHEGNHYIVKPKRHVKNIKPGRKLTIIISGKPGSVNPEPVDIKLTDIYQRLAEKDKQWQDYVNQKTAEEFGKSFIDGYSYLCSRFESDTPYTTYYSMIQKCPVEKFTDKKFTRVKIPTNDGLTLTGVFFPVKKAKGTLIVLHGRQCCAMTVVQSIDYLVDNGYQVLAYDARYWNYYRTPEVYKAETKKDIDDIGAAINFLKSRKDVDDNKIGLYGASYGAYKTAIAAGSYTDDIKVAIMDSGFANLGMFMDSATYEMAKEPLIRKFFNIPDSQPIPESAYLMSDCTLSLKKAVCPLLFLRGMKDTTISMEQQQLMYEGANSPKEIYYFPDMGHCDASNTADKEEFESRVLDFLNRYF